jgi:hypothetical protein
MSIALVAKAFRLRLGNPTRKIVLVKLADNMNDHGYGFPSYDEIAYLCEISKRSVIRHCKELEEQDIIKIVHRKSQHGNRSNAYWLNIPLVDSLLSEQNRKLKKSNFDSDNLSPFIEYDEPNEQKEHSVTPQNDTESPLKMTQCHPTSDTLSKKVDRGSPRTIIEPSIKHKDIITHSKKSDLDFSPWPALPSEQLFNDWLAVRKQKKAKLTQTAINRLAPHLVKAVDAGCSVDEVFELCVTRCWIGFEFDWLVNAGLVAKQAVNADWSDSVFDPEDPLV